ncbi:MAG: fibronectin type III domain-containing protein [Acidiferrobacterales bacterium]
MLNRSLPKVIILIFALTMAACKQGESKTAPTSGEQLVTPVAKGSVTLRWQPPTRNTDGSKLTDLAGYKIYYGTSKEYYQRVIDIKDPTITQYTINHLPPYTYYFVIIAYNRAGAESHYSNVGSKTIQ